MEKLQWLQQKYGTCPPQGSDLWFLNRQHSIGGSEVSTILNHNPYMSTSQLLSEKSSVNALDRTKPEHDCLMWGKLFEPVAKRYIQKHYGIQIHELGSIPHSKYPVSYSPDGVFIDPTNPKKLILLEIKCPWRRNVYSQTKGLCPIAPHYLDQVQCGLNTLPCDECWFFQFQYRRCSSSTSPNTTHFDRAYHMSFYKQCPPSKPLDYGYLSWPDTSRDNSLDLSCCTSLSDHINCRLDVPPHIHDQRQWNGAEQYPQSKVLHWKLFHVTRQVVQPNLNFLESNQNILWSTYQTLLSQQTH